MHVRACATAQRRRDASGHRQERALRSAVHLGRWGWRFSQRAEHHDDGQRRGAAALPAGTALGNCQWHGIYTFPPRQCALGPGPAGPGGGPGVSGSGSEVESTSCGHGPPAGLAPGPSMGAPSRAWGARHAGRARPGPPASGTGRPPPPGGGPGQLSAGWPASAWAQFNLTIFLHRTRLPRQASGMTVSNIQLRPQSASVSRATSEGAWRAASRLYDRSLPVACARAPARALRHAPKE
jgi:hypothetical protein